MFERFTDKACSAVAVANEAARELQTPGAAPCCFGPPGDRLIAETTDSELIEHARAAIAELGDQGDEPARYPGS